MFNHIELHPAIIDVPPNCLRCGRPTTGRIIQRGDLNGNGGRPYYFCDPCNKFNCFADMEDIDQETPDCHCGIPTRRQVTGWDEDPPGGFHYRCAIGGCEWFEWVDDGEGGIMRVLFDPPEARERAREERRL